MAEFNLPLETSWILWMNRQSDKIQTLTTFIGLSVLAHLLVMFSFGRFGNYNFSTPVNPQQIVMADLVKSSNETSPVADHDDQGSDNGSDNIAEDVENDRNAPVQVEEIDTPSAMQEKSLIEPEPVEPAVIGRENTAAFAASSEPTQDPQSTDSRNIAPVITILPPLRNAGEFLAAKTEKLSYLISLLGVPVGSAELEATNENGEVRITLRTRSNSALSSVFPVDDIIETRHIAGSFIITKIKQQEGVFRSDIGFTIFLRDKKVFWIDLIKNRYSNETIPNSEVLDILSSFYYLRNRPLRTGKTETLHIYDGDTYAPVPIEILRQEEVRLRSLKKAETLLLRHVHQKGGMFRRTGDMLIWLTNDENKVPVKFETTFPLGKLTAELVSSEIHNK